MNQFIIDSSLKYITTSYRLVVRLSKWINEELININYKDEKLIKALNEKDNEVIKTIIHLIKNRRVLDHYLWNYTKNFEIFKLIFNNGADLHYQNDSCFQEACYYNCYDVVEFLLDNDTFIEMNNYNSLISACYLGGYEIVKLLIRV